MIDIKVKIHDKYAFEFKISFIINKEEKDKDINEFSINTWLFVPNSLDINRSAYFKDQFYKDVISNVRLITPIYRLKEIYNTENGLIGSLRESFEALSENPESQEFRENYLYQIRMFLCICKSAIRDRAYYIREAPDESRIESLVDEYITDITLIARNYRKLRVIIDKKEMPAEIVEQFVFGDEFLGNIIEQQTFRILKGLKDTSVFNLIKKKLNESIKLENQYKKEKSYALLDEKDPSKNYLVIMRRSILKKIIESDLYLNTKKSKDGAFVEQFYYAIAAGVAMIFSTIIAFTAQMRYGNFTTPLFLALVVSYAFKDRIKDLMRYYLGNQLGKKYYDTKRILEVRNENIGWAKESFDFVREDKVPPEIVSIRKRSPLLEAENNLYNEKIILYKKLVNLSYDKINKDKYFSFAGINDITRFNLNQFILKMDDAFVPLYIGDDEKGYRVVDGEKLYILHFIIRCQSKDDLYYRKFRLLFNREGIKDITEINN